MDYGLQGSWVIRVASYDNLECKLLNYIANGLYIELAMTNLHCIGILF